MFKHCHQLTIEWGDCDPAGIVFYPRYFAMFDAATAFLLEAASGMSRVALIRRYGIVGWPMVDTRSIFHATASYDDKVTIQSQVVRLGRSSFDIVHQLRRHDVLCAEASETRVWATRQGDSIAAVPLPYEVRTMLAATA